MKMIPILLLALAASANAEVVAVAPADNGVIELHTDKGLCQDSLRATWVSRDQQTRIEGCWRPEANAVFIVLMDVSAYKIPAGNFTKPVTL